MRSDEWVKVFHWESLIAQWRLIHIRWFLIAKYFLSLTVRTPMGRVNPGLLGPKTLDSSNLAKRPRYLIALAIDQSHVTYMIVPTFCRIVMVTAAAYRERGATMATGKNKEGCEVFLLFSSLTLIKYLFTEVFSLSSSILFPRVLQGLFHIYMLQNQFSS